MKRVTLIQQNDTHDHVEAHWELRWRDGEPEAWRAGGFARIRYMVDQIRSETNGACVHVDCGDAIHGTGPAQWTKGAMSAAQRRPGAPNRRRHGAPIDGDTALVTVQTQRARPSLIAPTKSRQLLTLPTP